MTPRGVHLRYSFEASSQHGAQIENPLFELLSALQAQGSIAQAAQTLGQSYRHVWGALKRWDTQLGSPLVLWSKGKQARLTPFAERLLWAERQARARMAPHVEALRTELDRVFALANDPGLQWLDIFASHDLGLPRLQALAEQQHGVQIGLRFAGSEEALRSLLDGRCKVAGFHVPRLPQRTSVFASALRPLLKPGTHKLIGSHRRRQGLMLRPGAAGQGVLQGLSPDALLPALARGQGRFVNRQPGSGTRLLLLDLLLQAGLPDTLASGAMGIHGGDGTRVESTHLAVAAAVASGSADAGLGIEAAASAFGLDFHALADEDYFLVCSKDLLDTPAVLSLRQTLASAAWGEALAALPGYAPQRAGDVLSLTQVLPWWRFARPKPKPAAATR
jgi:molybdate transport repressor ModE-like protein